MESFLVRISRDWKFLYGATILYIDRTFISLMAMGLKAAESFILEIHPVYSSFLPHKLLNTIFQAS